ncbi:MAG: redoxin domain-containing protein [Gemmatimonadota bacterium]|jgi:peroxiredoxin
MSIQAGEKAPPFTLPDQPGSEIDVGERIGQRPVVLLFFPLAFSSVCTTEMCAMRDAWSQWSDLNADVFGISVDSPFVTAKFREENDIPFPLLSDFNKRVAADYGVLNEEFFGLHGVAKRSAFVIGTDGTVVYQWVTEDAGVEPDYQAVREAVAKAR